MRSRLLLLLLLTASTAADRPLFIEADTGDTKAGTWLPRCYSGGDCEQHNDCCHASSSSNSSNSSSVKQQQQAECQPATVVSGDLQLLQAGVRFTNCGHSPASVPAVDTGSGRVYRKQSCATGRRLQPAQLRVACRKTRNSPAQLRLLRRKAAAGEQLPSDCSVAWLLPLSQVRLCHPQLVTNCPAADYSNSSSECATMPTDYAVDKCGVVYRNSHCLQCWHTHTYACPFGGNHYGGFRTLLTVRLVLTSTDTDVYTGNQHSNSNSNSSSSSSSSNSSSNTLAAVEQQQQQHSLVARDAAVATALLLSILLLVAMATAYLSLPLLRNQAAWLLACHSGSLAGSSLCHLLSLVLQLQSPWCEVLAGCTLQFTLSAFAFAGGFGLQLLRSVRSRQPSGASKWSRPSVALAGCGGPGVVVGANVALHLCVGLIDQATCRFRHERAWAMLALTVAPLCCVLACNCGLAVAIGSRLGAGQSDTRRATLKVSLLLGVAWLPFFAAHALVAEADSLWLLAADLLCALHGALLFCTFVLANRRARLALAAAVRSASSSSSADSGKQLRRDRNRETRNTLL